MAQAYDFFLNDQRSEDERGDELKHFIDELHDMAVFVKKLKNSVIMMNDEFEKITIRDDILDLKVKENSSFDFDSFWVRSGLSKKYVVVVLENRIEEKNSEKFVVKKITFKNSISDRTIPVYLQLRSPYVPFDDEAETQQDLV